VDVAVCSHFRTHLKTKPPPTRAKNVPRPMQTPITPLETPLSCLLYQAELIFTQQRLPIGWKIILHTLQMERVRIVWVFK